MKFHIASALKFAAVTCGTVLWIGTAAAAPLPLFQTDSTASSLTGDQASPDLRRQTVNYSSLGRRTAGRRSEIPTTRLWGR